MSDPAELVLLEGHEPFLQRAVEMASAARQELVLLTQALEPRTWCAEPFVAAIQRFVLQNKHTRFRVLVADPRQAIVGGSRLVELGRRLSSFIEFRELGAERRQAVLEEYLVADGRTLLHRESTTQLESTYSGTPLRARLKLRDFDVLWNESTTAQELRDLKL